MCARSPEGQPYIALHQKKCDQQVKGGDSDPLLCSGETSSGVLCPALGPSTQEGHEPVGAGPEEGHKNYPRAGAPLLQGQTERVEVVQLGGEKAAGTPYSGLLVLKGAYRNDEENLLSKVCCDRTRSNVFKPKEGIFRLDIGKKIFTMRVVKLRNRLPREVVEVPSLETCKARLDGALSNLMQLKMSLLTARVLG